METYSYPTESTANERVNPVVLQDQILAVSLKTEGVVVQDAERAGNGCFETGRIDVLFAVSLTTAEQAALDQVVSAHVGKPVVSAMFKATAEVVHDSVDFEVGWADLGGVVTSVEGIVPDLEDALARVVGSYRADGDGAEIRVVVGLPGTDTPMSAVLALPDTGGVWAMIPGFNTNTPPLAGRQMYRLQGRLNAAISAAVMYTSMSLLELDS